MSDEEEQYDEEEYDEEGEGEEGGDENAAPAAAEEVFLYFLIVTIVIYFRSPRLSPLKPLSPQVVEELELWPLLLSKVLPLVELMPSLNPQNLFNAVNKITQLANHPSMTKPSSCDLKELFLFKLGLTNMPLRKV